MKKIKGLLFAFVALFAFTLAIVIGNAAEVKFGTYKVTTTTNPNDTATWDYSGVVATTFAEKDVLTGGVVVDDTGKTGQATKGIANGLDVYSGNPASSKGGTILVPVPAGSAGTFTLYTQGNQSSRLLRLNDGTEKTVASQVAGKNLTFAAEDITTSGSSTYLSLTGFDSTGANKEIKISKMVVTLTTGAYEASAELVNVTFHDGDNVLKVEEVEVGSVPSYSPTKWGYDLEGVYTDEGLTSPANLTTPIEAATDLYAKFTPWAEGTIKDPNVFDLDMMSKGNDVFGAGTTGEVALEGTNYTLLGGNTTFAASAKVVGEFGTSTYALKTGGNLNKDTRQNGIRLDASNSGTLTVYARSGSSIKNVPINVIGTSTLASEEIGGTDVVAKEFRLEEGGSYFIGSTSGSLWIHYISFVADPEPSTEFFVQTGYNDEGTELVRGIMICEYVSQTEIEESFTQGQMKVEIYDSETLLLDITDLLIIANRLTNKGETYVAEVNGSPYEFGVKDNTLYVVAVIAVSNYAETGLAEEYVGKTLSVKVSVKVEETFQVIESKDIAVQGAAGRPQA